jgi:hypothetical protein
VESGQVDVSRPSDGRRPDPRLVGLLLVAALAAAIVAAQLWPASRRGVAIVPNSPPVAAISPTAVQASATPTPFQTLAFPTVPPAPTASPVLPLLAVATLPAAMVRRVLVPDSFPIQETYAWGAHAYLLGGTGGSVANRLFVVDLASQSDRTVSLPVGSDQVGSLAVDGDVLAFVAWHHSGPAGQPGAPCDSNVGQPIVWRLLVARLAADGLPGAFHEVARGTETRRFTDPVGPLCTGPQVPIVAVAGSQVALAVDAPTRAQPWASTIRRFDADGVATGTGIAVPGVVVSLSAVEGFMAWTVTTGAPPNAQGLAPPPTWSVGYALAGSDVASMIPGAGPGDGWWGPPTVAADDGLVWWAAFPGSWASGPSGTQVIRATSIPGSGSPTATATDVLGSLTGLDCRLDGAGSGQALLFCAPAAGQPGAFLLVRPSTALQFADPSMAGPVLAHDWLVWTGLSGSSQYVAGIPLAAIGP